ncbi:hypothetical protein CDD81_6374 [Ophiocordyceps australis]|uniref:Fe2OG dioxygenase domain-containing protein n=1 Tax=Ophiocordyceps australis TaxID=1399860 RepID=A0A2C5Y5Z1_9HYPO|nr:hypothetical protein CDD81_6374 [Ophiocordyceps australis]
MAPSMAVSKEGLVIPLIDFSKFLEGAPAEREATARALLHGLQTAGFVYLEKHPIAPSVVRRAFSLTAALFAQPASALQALKWTTPEANRGYSAMGREKVSQLPDNESVQKVRSQMPDLKESLEIGNEDDERFSNKWPDQRGSLVGFRADMLDFYHQCHELHLCLIKALCMALGSDQTLADSLTNPGDHILRLLHYPAVDATLFDKKPQQIRAGPHTDYGLATLLFQDSCGGLQVMSPTGSFVDATPIEGTIVVNAGDLLARCSNDLIKSTVHRVVQPPHKTGHQYPARYSIVFFGNPTRDTVIDTLPGTYTSDEDKKYERVIGTQWLIERLKATY